MIAKQVGQSQTLKLLAGIVPLASAACVASQRELHAADLLLRQFNPCRLPQLYSSQPDEAGHKQQKCSFSRHSASSNAASNIPLVSAAHLLQQTLPREWYCTLFRDMVEAVSNQFITLGIILQEVILV